MHGNRNQNVPKDKGKLKYCMKFHEKMEVQLRVRELSMSTNEKKKKTTLSYHIKTLRNLKNSSSIQLKN